MLDLHIQNVTKSDDIPLHSNFENWVNHSLQKSFDKIEQLIRIVDSQEIRELNKHYRNIDKATNILSFPEDQFDFLDYATLGDLVVCADIVKQEAKEQNKNEMDHWAHLIVHGMLHLQGFDHVENSDAEIMENLEVKILETMGISNPYNDNVFNSIDN